MGRRRKSAEGNSERERERESEKGGRGQNSTARYREDGGHREGTEGRGHDLGYRRVQEREERTTKRGEESGVEAGERYAWQKGFGFTAMLREERGHSGTDEEGRGAAGGMVWPRMCER